MPYVWYVSMPLGVTAHIVGCRQVSIYISAWASALLVLTGRAMPEPQIVGRADR